MNKLLFKSEYNNNGLISGLRVGGFLTLENADILKSELIALCNKVGNELDVKVVEIDDVDLSAIQLLIAFFKCLFVEDVNVNCDWDLTEEQKELFIKGGLSDKMLVK